jgi:hypothetical protein
MVLIKFANPGRMRRLLAEYEWGTSERDMGGGLRPCRLMDSRREYLETGNLQSPIIVWSKSRIKMYGNINRAFDI